MLASTAPGLHGITAADAYKTTWEIMSKQYSDTDLRIIEDTYKY